MADAALGVRLLRGRIENAGELRASLRAATPEDDEGLLTALLTEQGPAGLARVAGGFALMAESADRRRTLLARDRWSLQVLHWAGRDGRIDAAVGPCPLLAGSAEPDPGAVLEWLVYRQVLPPRTLFRDVSAVTPGVALDLVDGRGTADTVASTNGLLDDGRHAELDRLDDAALVDRLERVLRDAVATACAGRAEVAVMLSGGIDSTTIAALARDHTRVRAFTMAIPDGPGEDESGTVRATTDALGIPLEVVPVDTATYRRAIAEVTARVGRPGFHVRNAAFEVGFDAILARAAAAGLDRMLDGMSANLAVGTPGGRSDALRWLRPLARLLRPLPLDGMLSRLVLARADLPSSLPELATSLPRGVRLLDGGARARIAAAAWAAAAHLREPHEHALRAAALADLRVWVPRFLERAAILGQHHGVLVASPYHDARVLAFGLNLPMRALRRGRGPDKRLLHELARRHIRGCGCIASRSRGPHPSRAWSIRWPGSCCSPTGSSPTSCASMRRRSPPSSPPRAGCPASSASSSSSRSGAGSAAAARIPRRSASAWRRSAERLVSAAGRGWSGVRRRRSSRAHARR